jgi:transposase
MPRAYAQDLRIRVVRAVDGGMSARGAARLFAVAASTAIKWVQCWRESGRVAARPRGGGRRRALDEQAAWLLALAANEPDLTLAEIRERLAERGVVVGIASIWRFLARNGLSFKKNRARHRAGPRGRARRASGLAGRPAHA